MASKDRLTDVTAEDIKNLPLDQIEQLMKTLHEGQVDKILEAQEPLRAKYNAVMREVTLVVEKYGLTAHKYFSMSPSQLRKYISNFLLKEKGVQIPSERRAGFKVPPKYIDPANPEEHRWSGRGATPRWLRELEEHGRNREEFLVQSPPEGDEPA